MIIHQGTKLNAQELDLTNEGGSLTIAGKENRLICYYYLLTRIPPAHDFGPESPRQ